MIRVSRIIFDMFSIHHSYSTKPLNNDGNKMILTIAMVIMTIMMTIIIIMITIMVTMIMIMVMIIIMIIIMIIVMIMIVMIVIIKMILSITITITMTITITIIIMLWWWEISCSSISYPGQICGLSITFQNSGWSMDHQQVVLKYVTTTFGERCAMIYSTNTLPIWSASNWDTCM